MGKHRSIKLQSGYLWFQNAFDKRTIWFSLSRNYSERFQKIFGWYCWVLSVFFWKTKIPNCDGWWGWCGTILDSEFLLETWGRITTWMMDGCFFFFFGGGMSLVTSWNFKQNMGWNQRNSLVTLGLYGMTTCTPWSKYMANRPQKIGQKAGLKYKPIQGNCAIYPGVHPWTLIFSNTIMKVWFRWFSHANGWFSGSSR